MYETFLDDVPSLKGATTDFYSSIFEMVAGLVICYLWAGLNDYRMMLISLACLPLLMLGGVVMTKLRWKELFNKADGTTFDPYEETTSMMTDMVSNYRTVMGLGRQTVDSIMDKYQMSLDQIASSRLVKSHLVGLAFAYSIAIRFVFIAIIFYVGASFIQSEQREPEIVFNSIFYIFAGILGAGFVLSATPSW